MESVSFRLPDAEAYPDCEPHAHQVNLVIFKFFAG